MSETLLIIGPRDGGGISSVNAQVTQLLEESGRFRICSINTTPLRRRFKVIGYICLYMMAAGAILWRRPKYVYLQISQTGFLHQSLFLLIAKVLGRQTIAHFHATPQVTATTSSSQLGHILRSQNYIDKLIVLAESSRRDLVRAGWSGPIFVLPNFVRVEQAPAVVKALTERENLLYIGRMAERKGIFEILEMAKLLPGESFLFLGAFDNAATQERFAEQMKGVPNAKWIGPVFDNRKFEYIANSKLFLFPTETEVFPMSLLECMACGTVPLTTPVGLIPEIVEDGCNGRWIRSGDPVGTVDAITRILGEPSHWERLSRNGRATVLGKYSCEHVRTLVTEVVLHVPN